MKPAQHPGHAGQTTRNIDLAFQILDEAIAHPDALASIPEGAVVVPMPHSDPGLASLNLVLANTLSERGEHVWLHRVGVPAPERSEWRATEQPGVEYRTLHPRWATNPPPDQADLVIAYNRESDLLTVDLFGGRRAAVDVPIGDSVSLLVDLETEEVVGHRVPRFLEQAVQKSPRALGLLLFSNVQLTGITREEVITLRKRLAHGAPPAIPPHPTAAVIAEELALLSA